MLSQGNNTMLTDEMAHDVDGKEMLAGDVYAMAMIM